MKCYAPDGQLVCFHQWMDLTTRFWDHVGPWTAVARAYEVSTIFVGRPLVSLPPGRTPPLIWETMLFRLIKAPGQPPRRALHGDYDCILFCRYPDVRTARLGHRAAVQLVAGRDFAKNVRLARRADARSEAARVAAFRTPCPVKPSLHAAGRRRVQRSTRP